MTHPHGRRATGSAQPSRASIWALPMGSAFEGRLSVLFEVMVSKLEARLGVSVEAMRPNPIDPG